MAQSVFRKTRFVMSRSYRCGKAKMATAKR
jgi:hypothetical protein